MTNRDLPKGLSSAKVTADPSEKHNWIEKSLMSTRREFLLKGSALTAAIALTPTAALAAPARVSRREIGLDGITAEAFAEQLNTRFVVRSNGDGDVALLLAAVEPCTSGAATSVSAAAESQERFSLFFAGADSRPLSQNTYAFEHERLGRFEMFIVPVGRPASGCRAYEAVFDRPTPASRGPERGYSRNRNR